MFNTSPAAVGEMEAVFCDWAFQFERIDQEAAAVRTSRRRR